MDFLDLLKISYIPLVRCFSISCLHITVSPVLRRYTDLKPVAWMCWMFSETIVRKLETLKGAL